MKTSWALLAAAALLAPAVPASGADIAVTPPTLTLKLSPGESASTIAGAMVNAPPPTPFVVVLQLRAAGGSLPPGWVTSRPATITNASGPAQLPLVFAVPAAAPAGTYTAVLQPLVLSSTIPLAPAGRSLTATVTVTAKCAAPPTVALDAAPPPVLWPPNSRLEDVGISGRIVVPAGCGLQKAWYTLEDEYGQFESTGEVSPAPDGSFSLSVPVQVSRRADDLDGRSYRLAVYARDEAGLGASAARTFTVAHDRRRDK